MSIRLMSAVWSVTLPDSEKLVLLALADCANDEGGCWPSMATLATKCSKTDRTIQAAIKSLVAKGHLSRQENPGKGCHYTVHPRSGFTPEAASPPKRTHLTPEAASDKPSRTIISPTKASPSTEKRARKADEFPCPEGVDQLDWKGLIANRKAKRAALSPGAHRQIVNKLRKWSDAGWPPGPIVAHAAERGWTSVFETDEMRGQDGLRNRTNTVGGREPDSLLAALERARAEERAEAAASFDQANDPGAWGSLPPQLASHAGRA